MTNYPAGDFLIRLKNASRARLRTVECKSTKFIVAIAKTMQKCGFLDEVLEKDGKLYVRLRYRKKEPLLLDIQLVSKPGLRTYLGADELEKIKKPSIFIVSTPKGVMTSPEAVKKRLGGEIIAEVL